MISYDGLNKVLKEKGIGKSEHRSKSRIVFKNDCKDRRDEHGWLIDTCLDGQDTFVRLMEMLEIY